MHTRYRLLDLSIDDTCLKAVAYNIAKMQTKDTNIHCIAPTLKFLWYGKLEWSAKENLSMEWNTEWKIFSMKWKWNGRKLQGWNMKKSSSIPYHAPLTTQVK